MHNKRTTYTVQSHKNIKMTAVNQQQYNIKNEHSCHNIRPWQYISIIRLVCSKKVQQFCNNSVRSELTLQHTEQLDTWKYKYKPINSCHSALVNYEGFPQYSSLYNRELCHLTGLHYGECSKWYHFARVAAASVSEMDCIHGANCGSNWLNSGAIYRLNGSG